MEKKAYYRVYEILKHQIETGRYSVGELLPPEPKLEKEFAVSRTTVRRAVSILSEEGYIRVQQGKGTEVLSSDPSPRYYKFHNITGIREVLGDAKKSISLRSVYIDIVEADEEIAQALCVKKETKVFRIQRILCIEDLPFSLTKNYVRIDVAPGLDAHQGEFIDLYSFLMEKYGVVFHYGSEHISATVAGFVEAQLLEVDIGTPLLFCTRYAQSQDGPLEYAKTYLRTDRYDLVVQMHGWPSKGGSPMST